jgi:hypothetical protein
MSSMTSIEEIVKYQQELLNHQRNQKLLQKETIKLLNALNKNLTFMSDRLDEFALKTNIKLDEVSSANSSPTNLNNTTNLFNKLNNDLFLTTNNSNTTNINDSINLALVNNTSSTINNSNNLTPATIQQLITTATPLNIAVASAPQPTQTLMQPAAANVTPKQTNGKTTIKNSTINSSNTTPSNITNNNNTTNNNNRPYNKNQKVKEYFQFQNDNDSNLLDNKLQTYSIKLNSINNNNSVNNNFVTNNSNKLKNSPIKLSNKTINSLTNANLNLTAASTPATTTTVGTTIITAIPITTTSASPAITATTTTNQLISGKATIKQVISPMSNSIQTVLNSVASQNANGKRLIKDMNDNRTNRSSKLLDTTNTNGNKAHNSDESGDDMSYDETDDEEKETIQSKKKPRLSNSNGTTNGSVKVKDSEESNNQQRLFNKFVRESVERRLGKEFLLLHEIQEIDSEVMEIIKKEALQAYPPINIRPRRAWHLAKASLRCRRRSLRRQQEKQVTGNGNTQSIKQENSSSSTSISTISATATTACKNTANIVSSNDANSVSNFINV